jgi:hypothetical protein
MTMPITDDIVSLLKLHRLCPEMRFAQMLATLGLLGDDVTDHSLWDLEDEEFLGAIERFRQDLLRRQPVTA